MECFQNPISRVSEIVGKEWQENVWMKFMDFRTAMLLQTRAPGVI